MNNQEPESKSLTRRTVTKAAGWSIPVITLASATPAAAASGGLTQVLVVPSCATSADHAAYFHITADGVIPAGTQIFVIDKTEVTGKGAIGTVGFVTSVADLDVPSQGASYPIAGSQTFTFINNHSGSDPIRFRIVHIPGSAWEGVATFEVMVSVPAEFEVPATYNNAILGEYDESILSLQNWLYCLV